MRKTTVGVLAALVNREAQREDLEGISAGNGQPVLPGVEDIPIGVERGKK
jgi:hypothetical protein